MACDAIFDDIPSMTESLSEEIAYINQNGSDIVLSHVVPIGQFPVGRGLVQTGFISPRQEPTATQVTWVDETLVTEGNDQGACAIDYADLNYGETQYTYQPFKGAWWSDVICRNQLNYLFNVKEFFDDYVQRMANQSRKIIEIKKAQLYDGFARKAICTATGIEISEPGAALTGLDIVGSVLTQSRLEEVAAQLTYDCAFNVNGNQFVNIPGNGLVTTLSLGQKMSLQLMRNDPAYRDDIRFATMGEGQAAPLLMRMGASQKLGNFMHLPRTVPDRYTQNAETGDLTFVEPYEQVSTTRGTQSVLTQAWKDAPIEMARVIDPSVYKIEMDMPSSGIGTASFQDVSWSGVPKWVVGEYKWNQACVDITEDKGRFVFNYRAAAKKWHPEVGYDIFYLRCDQIHTTVTCSG